MSEMISLHDHIDNKIKKKEDELNALKMVREGIIKYFPNITDRPMQFINLFGIYKIELGRLGHIHFNCNHNSVGCHVYLGKIQSGEGRDPEAIFIQKENLTEQDYKQIGQYLKETLIKWNVDF
jgi:hypothetical protein